jgi:hypothetical protein
VQRLLLSLITIAGLTLATSGSTEAAPSDAQKNSGAKKAKAGASGAKGAKRNSSPKKAEATKRAKSAKKSKARRTAKRKKKKRTGRRRRNTPPGWTWPPSDDMRAQGERCHKELTRLGLDWKKVKRRRNIATPVVVKSMNFGGLMVEPKFRKPPFVMDCHLAKSLAEAGPALVALGVRALRFSSIHSYRKVRVNGRTKSMLSRHAYGLAVDIYEVDPSEGERLFIKEDYVAADEGDVNLGDRGAQFLRQVESESNASGQFRMVLSPANDPRSHYDHFHFEARVGSIDGKKTKRPKRRKRKKQKQKRKKRKHVSSAQ